MSAEADPVTSGARTTTRKGTMTKARILHAAAELFAKNGYHATGLSELGDAVGLGRGALYYHIGSKENLLYELSVRHVEEMVAYGEMILGSPLGAEERFRRLSRKLMRVISDNLPELTVFFREINSFSGERRDRIHELRERFEGVWLQVLSDGEGEGLFQHGDNLTVKAVLGMHNYSYLWIDPEGSLSPEEIADRFCDLLLHGLMKHP
jgi:AcrR family transcriptional regulator